MGLNRISWKRSVKSIQVELTLNPTDGFKSD